MTQEAESQQAKTRHSLGRQVQRNLLSIISLVVALTALGYNTYRNELTETNRNIRSASFIMLQELSQLQLVADHAYYAKDESKGDAIDGWGRVLYLRDMSLLVTPQVVARTETLFKVWESDSGKLTQELAANERITEAINALKDEVRATISALD